MGFFARLKEGLHRARVNLAGLFSGAVVDEDFFDELETSLIAADIGYEPTRLILQRLKDTVKLNGLKTPEEVRRALRDEIVRILLPAQKPLDVNRAKPFVMMMAGVNGAGSPFPGSSGARRWCGWGWRRWSRCSSGRPAACAPARYGAPRP